MTQTRLYLIWFCCVHTAVLINNQIAEIHLSSGKATKSLREEKVVSCHWISLLILSFALSNVRAINQEFENHIKERQTHVMARLVPTLHQDSHQHKDSLTRGAMQPSVEMRDIDLLFLSFSVTPSGSAGTH